MAVHGGRADVGDTIAALRKHADELHDTVRALYDELDKLAELTESGEEGDRDRPRG